MKKLCLLLLAMTGCSAGATSVIPTNLTADSLEDLLTAGITVDVESTLTGGTWSGVDLLGTSTQFEPFTFTINEDGSHTFPSYAPPYMQTEDDTAPASPFDDESTADFTCLSGAPAGEARHGGWLHVDSTETIFSESAESVTVYIYWRGRNYDECCRDSSYPLADLESYCAQQESIGEYSETPEDASDHATVGVVAAGEDFFVLQSGVEYYLFTRQ